MIREDLGFWKTLFNWDFTHFLTLRYIKGTYILWFVLTLIYVVIGEYFVARNFTGGTRVGLIIAVPVVALIVMIVARITLELNLIFFRIERHLRKISGERD